MYRQRAPSGGHQVNGDSPLAWRAVSFEAGTADGAVRLDSRGARSQGGLEEAMTIPTVDSRPPLQVGETAPDFTLPLVSEEGTVSLADYRDRTPVLIVLLRYIW
jgi:hypothetical protein